VTWGLQAPASKLHCLSTAEARAASSSQLITWKYKLSCLHLCSPNICFPSPVQKPQRKGAWHGGRVCGGENAILTRPLGSAGPARHLPLMWGEQLLKHGLLRVRGKVLGDLSECPILLAVCERAMWLWENHRASASVSSIKWDDEYYDLKLILIRP
jgi:hypothetical protein